MRAPRSPEKTDGWATHGMDPHELLVLLERLGAFAAGMLMVANSGIATLPVTGRSERNVDRMDAPLVALKPQSGELLVRCRLADPFLGIRHLAWRASIQRLGIAPQAEHPAAEVHWRTLVLAVWAGNRWVTVPDPPDFSGYGAAAAARPGGGFLVGWPRTNALALFDAKARWTHSLALPDALRGGGERRPVVGRRRYRRVARGARLRRAASVGCRAPSAAPGQSLAGLAGLARGGRSVSPGGTTQANQIQSRLIRPIEPDAVLCAVKPAGRRIRWRAGRRSPALCARVRAPAPPARWTRFVPPAS